MATRALAKTILRLSATTKRLQTKLGPFEMFVLRATETEDGRGGVIKQHAATTVAPYPCSYSVMPISARALEEQRASGSKPVIYRRFICASDVDVLHTDRLRLVALGDVPQTDMEIIKIAPLSGVAKEIVTIEEIPDS